MGREELESGALHAVPGNNFKLNTGRNLTGGTLVADAGTAMAGAPVRPRSDWGATSGRAPGACWRSSPPALAH